MLLKTQFILKITTKKPPKQNKKNSKNKSETHKKKKKKRSLGAIYMVALSPSVLQSSCSYIESV